MSFPKAWAHLVHQHLLLHGVGGNEAHNLGGLRLAQPVDARGGLRLFRKNR